MPVRVALFGRGRENGENLEEMLVADMFVRGKSFGPRCSGFSHVHI